jgi:hypothetical protein
MPSEPSQAFTLSPDDHHPFDESRPVPAGGEPVKKTPAVNPDSTFLISDALTDGCTRRSINSDRIYRISDMKKYIINSEADNIIRAFMFAFPAGLLCWAILIYFILV